MPADLPPPFVCMVRSVYDGDGPITCANGIKVRVAGVQAPDFERAAPCRRRPRPVAYTCDDAAAMRARRIVERLVLHKRVACQPVGRSYQRIVARCTVGGVDLSCAIIASGAGVRWDSWWRRYRMGECR